MDNIPQIQLIHVFMAVCIIIAYLRFLRYLTPIEFLGVVVITVFHMMEAVLRFGLIFIFIVLGFSAGFHSLYGNLLDYYNWTSATLNTLIRTLSGYQIPTYTNLLAFPGPVVGLILHTLYIVIGVVLLLNFLIALMNSIYSEIQGNAKEQYRWMNTIGLTQLDYTPWPPPFIILQAIFAVIYLGIYSCNENFARKLFGEDMSLEPTVLESEIVEKTSRREEFMGRMVGNYFSELFKDGEKTDQFDDFNEDSSNKKEKERE